MKLSNGNQSIIHSVILALIIAGNESICMEGKLSWMDPIKAYLKFGTLSEDKKEVDKVRKLSTLFYLENDRLYKCNFLMPLLMCLNEEEAEYVLRDLHEGICGSHAIGSSIAFKASRNDYFLPTMKVDALNLVKGCDKCQRHAHILRKLSVE